MMNDQEINEFIDKVRGGGDSEYLPWMPRVADMTHYSINVLRANPECGLMDIPRLVQDGAYREQLLKQVRNNDARDYWELYGSQPAQVQREWSEAFLNRVLGVLRYSH